MLPLENVDAELQEGSVNAVRRGKSRELTIIHSILRFARISNF